MWALIIAFMIDSVPPEAKYIQLAEVKTYQECRDLSTVLKARGLNNDVFLFCVERQWPFLFLCCLFALIQIVSLCSQLDTFK